MIPNDNDVYISFIILRTNKAKLRLRAADIAKRVAEMRLALAPTRSARGCRHEPYNVSPV